eukprot:jgi/Bigna1/68501/fgenesh1_pg.6_\
MKHLVLPDLFSFSDWESELRRSFFSTVTTALGFLRFCVVRCEREISLLGWGKEDSEACCEEDDDACSPQEKCASQCAAISASGYILRRWWWWGKKDEDGEEDGKATDTCASILTQSRPGMPSCAREGRRASCRHWQQKQNREPTTPPPLSSTTTVQWISGRMGLLVSIYYLVAVVGRPPKDFRTQCTICGRDFSCPGNLRRHRKNHIPIFDFTCITCGRSFREKRNLGRHRLIHTGQKPYPCPTCNATFRQHVHVHQHIMAQHSPHLKAKCKLCAMKFSSSKEIPGHMYLRHPQNRTLPKKTFLFPSGLKVDLCTIEPCMNEHTRVYGFLCEPGRGFSDRCNIYSFSNSVIGVDLAVGKLGTSRELSSQRQELSLLASLDIKDD